MKKGYEEEKMCRNIVAYSKIRYIKHSDTARFFSRF